MAFPIGSTAGQESRPNSIFCDLATKSEERPDLLESIGETGSSDEPSNRQQTRCHLVIRLRANSCRPFDSSNWLPLQKNKQLL